MNWFSYPMLAIYLLIIIAIIWYGSTWSKNTGFKIVRFYMPKCGACISTKSAWDEFVKTNPLIQTVEIDGTDPKNKKLVEQYNIKYFPTYLKIREEIDVYSGDRSAADLTKFANK